MDVNVFRPVFSKCSVHQLTALYREEFLCNVNSDGQIVVYDVEKDSATIIADLKALIKDAVTRFSDENGQIPDEQARANISFLIDLQDAIIGHFGVSWFEGKPLLMSRKGFKKWKKDNHKFGVEPT